MMIVCLPVNFQCTFPLIVGMPVSIPNSNSGTDDDQPNDAESSSTFDNPMDDDASVLDDDASVSDGEYSMSFPANCRNAN